LHVVSPNIGATAYVENTNTSGEPIGVYGKTITTPGFGVGIKGDGGYIGVMGLGTTLSMDLTIGVEGQATGAATNIGVKGMSDYNEPASYNIGVYGTAEKGAHPLGIVCNGSGTYSGTWTNPSDQKFKTDISPVKGALDLIGLLNPVSYKMNRDEYPMMNFPAFRQYGFVAQELEKVIPLLVEFGAHPGATKEDKPIEYKAVNYIGMIPILTKALQELNEKNISQEQAITELKTELADQKARLDKLERMIGK
jgi:hypothetical protein